MKNTNIDILILSILLAISNIQAVAQNVKITSVESEKDVATGMYGFENKNEDTRSHWYKHAKRISFGLLGSKIGGSTKNKLLIQGNDDEWVISPQYENAAKYFSENLAGVQCRGKVGFIDQRNRFMVEPQFDAVKHLNGFNLGLAAVKKDGKYGFIDKKGNFVIPPTFEYAENFRDNYLATVKMEGKFGAINLKGEIVVPCKYLLEEAMINVPISNKVYKQMQEKIAREKNDGLFDEQIDNIQASARQVNKHIRDSVYMPSVSNKVKFSKKNGLVGAFTLKGDTIIPQIYNEITAMENGLMMLEKNDKFGISDMYGRLILPCSFDIINYDNKAHVIVVKKDDLFGLYTCSGMMILPPSLDGIDNFIDGKAIAWMNYECGLVNTKGEITDSLLERVFIKAAKMDEAGDNRSARLIYQQILKAQPDFAMAHNNIGIMDIEGEDYNEGMSRLKVAHRLDPDNKEIADNLKQAKKDRTERRWNRVGNVMEATLAVFTVAATTYATVETVKNGGNVSSSGGSISGGSSISSSSGSDKCAFYRSEIARFEEKIKKESQSVGLKNARADGKNAAHQISPERVDGASSSDYRVINSQKATIRQYQKHVDLLKSNARKIGCSL